MILKTCREGKENPSFQSFPGSCPRIISEFKCRTMNAQEWQTAFPSKTLIPEWSQEQQTMNLLHPWLPQAERSKATTGFRASALMWQVFTNKVTSGFLTCVLDFTLLSVDIPGTRAFVWLPWFKQLDRRWNEILLLGKALSLWAGVRVCVLMIWELPNSSKLLT